MWPKVLMTMATAACMAIATEVHEIDVLPLLPFRLLQLPRMRWTELNRALGLQAGDKMLTSNPMDTMLGKINVPKEDRKAFEKLTPSEVKSLYGDDEFLPEKDVWIAYDLIQEGDIPSALEMLEKVKNQVESKFGKKHPLYANALADLGYAYMEKKDFIKSNELLVEAMFVDEELQDKFGMYNTAASVNLMAESALRSGVGNFNTLSNALESTFNGLHKASHEAQLDILLNLANMYRIHWLSLRAINMFKLAKQYAKNPSKKYADLLLGLGASYIMEGELQQARGVLETAVDMFNTLRPGRQGHIEAMYYMGVTEMLLHKYGSALQTFQKLRKQLNPPESFPCARAVLMTSIAQCLVGLDYPDQAIGMLEAAQTLLKDSAARLENEQFAPYIQVKIDHLLANLWKTDTEKHKAAYDGFVSLFGDTHALAVMHKL